MTKVQNVTIYANGKAKGSNMTTWNIDLNGKPFGQIWTYKAKGEVHPFHVKTLNGYYASFNTYALAERAIRGEM